MFRFLASLSLLALAVPAFAQETMPAPTSAPAAATQTMPAKKGMFSRVFRSRDNSTVIVTTPVVAVPSTTIGSTTTIGTSTAGMEPMYDRRGRIIGYRSVATTPATKISQVAPTQAPMPNPITQTGAVEMKSEMKKDNAVVQAGAIEPMPEPVQKRGLLYRLGLKK